jgi:hypothetical protein
LAQIIPFIARADRFADDSDIDLFTAVDVAIRDLRDILAAWGEEPARLQAEECRKMLEQALDAAREIPWP